MVLGKYLVFRYFNPEGWGHSCKADFCKAVEEGAAAAGVESNAVTYQAAMAACAPGPSES